MGRRISKHNNIKNWKKGINDIKNINSVLFTKNLRGGIRL